MCSSNRDVVSEVPAARWDVDAAAQLTGMDKHPREVGLRTRHGGFLRDAELFDNAFFRIGPAEAAVMDPQQRLLLEHGYAALHGAGRRKPDLLGSATSVYVGVWASEYAEVLRQSAAAQSVFVGTAYACSVMAGRLSFVLGLQGPCASFDTACSSSLVACHSGILDLHHQESDQALVAGVNMLFNPHANAMNAIAGMTSARGRSHSFDARADGYVRCEACCAVALEHAAPEQSASSNVLGCAQAGRACFALSPVLAGLRPGRVLLPQQRHSGLRMWWVFLAGSP